MYFNGALDYSHLFFTINCNLAFLLQFGSKPDEAKIFRQTFLYDNITDPLRNIIGVISQRTTIPHQM